MSSQESEVHGQIKPMNSRSSSERACDIPTLSYFFSLLYLLLPPSSLRLFVTALCLPFPNFHSFSCPSVFPFSPLSNYDQKRKKVEEKKEKRKRKEKKKDKKKKKRENFSSQSLCVSAILLPSFFDDFRPPSAPRLLLYTLNTYCTYFYASLTPLPFNYPHSSLPPSTYPLTPLYPQLRPTPLYPSTTPTPLYHSTTPTPLYPSTTPPSLALQLHPLLYLQLPTLSTTLQLHPHPSLTLNLPPLLSTHSKQTPTPLSLQHPTPLYLQLPPLLSPSTTPTPFLPFNSPLPLYPSTYPHSSTSTLHPSTTPHSTLQLPPLLPFNSPPLYLLPFNYPHSSLPFNYPHSSLPFNYPHSLPQLPPLSPLPNSSLPFNYPHSSTSLPPLLSNLQYPTPLFLPLQLPPTPFSYPSTPLLLSTLQLHLSLLLTQSHSIPLCFLTPTTLYPPSTLPPLPFTRPSLYT
ncbi:hypothetical protein C7M84_017454 [Penaeus vannamei]|uniref:Uncharacterized protein n=1 Tax=Penaeus vannamei TaxID=6689 RepID=A0A423SK40_PENVA|nr:hypothetical protein C7M84_017454 [Penaeus vannamei]